MKFDEDIRMKEINLLESLLSQKYQTTSWKIKYIEFMERQNEDKIYSIEEYINQIN